METIFIMKIGAAEYKSISGIRDLYPDRWDSGIGGYTEYICHLPDSWLVDTRSMAGMKRSLHPFVRWGEFMMRRLNILNDKTCFLTEKGIQKKNAVYICFSQIKGFRITNEPHWDNDQLFCDFSFIRSFGKGGAFNRSNVTVEQRKRIAEMERWYKTNFPIAWIGVRHLFRIWSLDGNPLTMEEIKMLNLMWREKEKVG